MNKELVIRNKAYWVTRWEPCGSSKSAQSAWCSNCGLLSQMSVGDYCKWCGSKMIGHIENTAGDWNESNIDEITKLHNNLDKLLEV